MVTRNPFARKMLTRNERLKTTMGRGVQPGALWKS